MPAFLLTLLASPKAWAALGVAALLAFAGVQTLRLNNAKHDEATAKAALLDPATKMPWRDEAVVAATNLSTCRASLADESAALDVQSAAVTALKAEGDADTARANAALEARQAASQAAAQTAARVLAFQAPAGASDCQALTALRASTQ